MAEKKQSEKETKKIISEDVENFFRDVWGKVVEYASLGAEEATKVSATAKTRVDIETLKFKRGKLLKMLGERYWELVDKDSSLTVSGTGEIIRQIKALDKEVAGLEKELAKKENRKKSASETAKKPASKKPAAKKTASRKPAAKKAGAKKTTASKPKTTSKPKAGPSAAEIEEPTPAPYEREE
ncbi:MAG: hypothetical protein PVJ01_05245 [Pseudomonadota bacterium]